MLRGAGPLGTRLPRWLGRSSRAGHLLRPLYDRYLRARFAGSGMPWTINGVPCRIDPRLRHLMTSDYDAAVAAYLAARIEPGDLCLNVGANVGVYTLQLAHWCGPSGRVIAFEPNPETLRVLERHLTFNGLGGRVRAVGAAVGAAVGEAELFTAGIDGMSRLGEPNPLLADRARAVPVPVTTLDTFCGGEGLEPDWLLIDIEGFEIAALRGAGELIRRRGPSLGIVVEMHPQVWESAGTGPDEAAAVIDALGRHPVPLGDQRDPFADYGLVALEPASSRRE